MKKLIALMFCLALLGTVAQAQQKAKTMAPKTTHGEMSMRTVPPSTEKIEKKADRFQKAVGQQVENTQRKVELEVCVKAAKNNSCVGNHAKGEAVIMGTNQDGSLVLLTTKDLADAITLLDESGEGTRYLGKIVNMQNSYVAVGLRTAGPSKLLLQVTMPPVGVAQKFKMITERRALELLDMKK